MADRVRLAYEGIVLPDGSVKLESNGRIIPEFYVSLATSQETLENNIVAGDFVSNVDNSIIGIVTTTGYVMLYNKNNPAQVGKHNLYDVSKIDDLGFRAITVQELYEISTE